ncbi:CPCC family cysteine-rich protein, partial [Bacillus velezensis]
MKYTCPCCGYRTIEEEPPGTYEICNICYWEDDEVQ